MTRRITRLALGFAWAPFRLLDRLLGFLLLLPVVGYWIAVPKRFRRVCLFRESCSRHVFHGLETRGAIHGLRRFRGRFAKCRTGYSIVMEREGLRLRFADGTISQNDELAPWVCRSIGDDLDRVAAIVQADYAAGRRGVDGERLVPQATSEAA